MSSAHGDEVSSGTARLGRILLVDDQAQNRDMLGRRLERRGYDVVLRESAVGIEDTIASEKIELVLLIASFVDNRTITDRGVRRLELR